ncbi:hypothetical protein [Porphyromonas canoris]|uniref:hypothetical protein n=1 Tax=Porphyromonas canoris TaxID=36875 RepID=UPI0012699673|nr:hypothetical protein [Porphyromonas canoris]
MYKNFTLNGILVQARYCLGTHRRLPFFRLRVMAKRAFPGHSEKGGKEHPERGTTPQNRESGNKKSVRISAPNAFRIISP